MTRSSDCALTRDLLPLYHEELLSPESAAWVAAHLADCPDCARHLQALAADLPAPQPAAGLPLRTVGRAITRRRYLTALLTACLVLAGILIAGAALTNPRYIAEPDRLRITERADEVIVAFDTPVTGYSLEPLDGPDAADSPQVIEIWTTPWDVLTRKRPPAPIILERAAVPCLYLMGDANRDLKPLYPTGTPTPGILLLNHLALGVYGVFAGIGLLACGLAAVLLRRRAPRASRVFRTLAFLSLAYGLATVGIKGLWTPTRHLLRDLTLILALTVPLFGILVIGTAKWADRRRDSMPPRREP